jgi:hypothetical protein
MTSEHDHQEQTERYRRMTEILFKYESVMTAAIRHFSIEPGSSIYVSPEDMAFFRRELGITPVREVTPDKQPLDYERLPESRL